jgi:hypothetical protein
LLVFFVHLSFLESWQKIQAKKFILKKRRYFFMSGTTPWWQNFANTVGTPVASYGATELRRQNIKVRQHNSFIRRLQTDFCLKNGVIDLEEYIPLQIKVNEVSPGEVTEKVVKHFKTLSRKDQEINDRYNFEKNGTELTYTETSWFNREGTIEVKPRKSKVTLASSDLVSASQLIGPTSSSANPPLASISFFSYNPFINEPGFKKEFISLSGDRLPLLSGAVPLEQQNSPASNNFTTSFDSMFCNYPFVKNFGFKGKPFIQPERFCPCPVYTIGEAQPGPSSNYEIKSAVKSFERPGDNFISFCVIVFLLYGGMFIKDKFFPQFALRKELSEIDILLGYQKKELSFNQAYILLTQGSRMSAESATAFLNDSLLEQREISSEHK